ncbi:BTRC [Cordylochernes scorpioides]|uniref:BTRC n=1 Tax=Cordylochernes scorpioides TaxID=51811 RepID=A0ABY6JZF9_9ARAC|nr:BTRC [Cordylochernes scorpioides]
MQQEPMTVIGNNVRKEECCDDAEVQRQMESCLCQFEKWGEAEQIHHVQNLISKMSHHQHSQLNSFLKPMLQRDFISMLPSEYHYPLPLKPLGCELP